MINLYHLKMKFFEFENKLRESEGEITEEIKQMFSEIKAEREEKLEALASLIKNTNSEIEAFKKEELRLREARNKLEARTERLQDMIKELLPNDLKWEDGTHKVYYTKSMGVDVIDEELVPKEFFRIKTIEEIDKKLATAYFKQEMEAMGFADIPGLRYSERFNLQVK